MRDLLEKTLESITDEESKEAPKKSLKEMATDEELEKYLSKAWDYYRGLNIVPDKEELLDYVVQELEEEAGVTFTEEQVKKVEEELFGDEDMDDEMKEAREKHLAGRTSKMAESEGGIDYRKYADKAWSGYGSGHRPARHIKPEALDDSGVLDDAFDYFAEELGREATEKEGRKLIAAVFDWTPREVEKFLKLSSFEIGLDTSERLGMKERMKEARKKRLAELKKKETLSGVEEEELKRYLKQAWKYYEDKNIKPVKEDLLDYIVKELEKETGVTFTKEQIKKIDIDLWGKDPHKLYSMTMLAAGYVGVERNGEVEDFLRGPLTFMLERVDCELLLERDLHLADILWFKIVKKGAVEETLEEGQKMYTVKASGVPSNLIFKNIKATNEQEALDKFKKLLEDDETVEADIEDLEPKAFEDAEVTAAEVTPAEEVDTPEEPKAPEGSEEEEIEEEEAKDEE